MGTKNMKLTGAGTKVEMLDGFAIEHYAAAFSGRFDSDEIDLENVAYDDHLCFIVMGQAGEARFKPDKDGELVRTTIFNPLRVVQISPELAERALQAHSKGTNAPQLPLYANDLDDNSDSVNDDNDDEDDEWESPAPPPPKPAVYTDPKVAEWIATGPTPNG